MDRVFAATRTFAPQANLFSFKEYSRYTFKSKEEGTPEIISRPAILKHATRRPTNVKFTAMAQNLIVAKRACNGSCVS
jgi:hypothetical protein